MIFDQELMDQLIFGMEISNNKRNWDYSLYIVVARYTQLCLELPKVIVECLMLSIWWLYWCGIVKNKRFQYFKPSWTKWLFLYSPILLKNLSITNIFQRNGRILVISGLQINTQERWKSRLPLQLAILKYF